MQLSIKDPLYKEKLALHNILIAIAFDEWRQNVEKFFRENIEQEEHENLPIGHPTIDLIKLLTQTCKFYAPEVYERKEKKQFISPESFIEAVKQFVYNGVKVK